MFSNLILVFIELFKVFEKVEDFGVRLWSVVVWCSCVGGVFNFRVGV